MVIGKDTILYFSGTGNSLQVAKDLNSELKDFKLCNISSIITEEKIKIEGKVLEIIFPVIYARLPLILERILEKLEINKDIYVFAIATHGGAPAEVLIKLRKIIKSKCIVLNYGFLIHMPGNNIFAYGANSIEKQNKIFEREKEKVRKISLIIRERTNYKCELSKLIIDTLIDKPIWEHSCEQCAACIQYCPKQAIQWEKKTTKRKRYRNLNIKVTELIQ